MAQYWSDLDVSRMPKRRIRGSNMERGEPVLSEPEVDDPVGSLRLFVEGVEELLREDDAVEGFAEVKARLLEVIETPTTMTVDTV